jgi:hypothetical protein
MTSTVMKDQRESKDTTCSNPADEKLQVEPVVQMLERILAKESTLPPRELGHYKDRLLKTVPSLEEAHLSVVYQSLKAAIDGDDCGEARDNLVQHSLVHNGISSWVLPLRRVIEGVLI